MFIKKHDTKSIYPLFWAFIAFSAIFFPYVGKLFSQKKGTQFISMLVVALIAGTSVFFKSRIDLFRYKNVYNELVHQNIEIMLNSSVEICTHKHTDKNEIFYAEFLEYDHKKQLLRSSIRSDNVKEKIKDLSKQNLNFPESLDRHQGFAGATISDVEMRLKKIDSNDEWGDYLRRSKSRLPIIFDAVNISKEYLHYSEDEFEYITKNLGIKSVIACPIVTFRQGLFKTTKKGSIKGVIIYYSNLPYKSRGEEAGQQLSSLEDYRREVLIQAWTISKYSMIYEETKKKEQKE